MSKIATIHNSPNEQEAIDIGNNGLNGLERVMRVSRRLVLSLMAMATTAGSAGCYEAEDFGRNESPGESDLLFSEPSEFSELPNGDIEYSITYMNNGVDPIDRPYDIQLRLMEHKLGKRLPFSNWPKTIEGQLLDPGETATIEGVVTSTEKEVGGRHMTIILDPQHETSDEYRFNNTYNSDLPGPVVGPSCSTQVDADWGNEAEGRPVPDLNSTIEESGLENFIRWNNESTTENLLSYNDWPEDWKQELRIKFREAWDWFESGTPKVVASEKPENLLYRYCITDRCEEAEITEGTYFSIEDAREMYMEQVAGSLAAKTGEWFTWSRDGTGAYNFKWRNRMEYVPSVRANAINFTVDDALSEADFNGDSEAMKVVGGEFADITPQEILLFMKENSLIGKTAHDTVALFLAWSKRMSHVAGEPYSGVQQKHYWSYAGDAPISAVLYGTVNEDPKIVRGSGLTKRHWVFGCWGTAALLRHVLTTASIGTDKMWIPIEGDIHESAIGGHALSSFQTEEGFTFLSHNDDLYGKNTKSMNICPEDLMNPKSKLDEWFLGQSDATQTQKNVGRRPVELDVEKISGHLLDKYYCMDRKAGLSPAEGSVYNDYLKRYFTLEELEAKRLWERLEERASECDQWE